MPLKNIKLYSRAGNGSGTYYPNVTNEIMTEYNGIISLNYEEVTFKQVVTINGTVTSRAQSTVTVPMKQNLCGAPTNLIIRIQYGISNDFNIVKLSWSPPSNGSCQITSYTVFWCHISQPGNICKVSYYF